MNSVRALKIAALTSLSYFAVSSAVMAQGGKEAHSADPATIAGDFQMERCVNMGNALEAPNGSPWGRLYRQDDYDRIAKAGFDTVRIPVRWSDYTGPAPRYRIHPDFAELVDQNIEWALANDLNIILNIHHFEEIMEEPASQHARFAALWQQMSQRYADLPGNVWFEVLNEPSKNLKGEEMRELQALGLQTIRQYNPDRIVILGGEEWSAIRTLDSNLTSEDPNVVYTFHYYDPFDFTHQQARWLGEDMPEGTRGWGSDEDTAALNSAVHTATAFRSKTGRPVFVGEFGVHSPVNNEDRVKWAGAIVQAMEGADIPWCLWSYGNTFAAYNDEGGWDQDMLNALIRD